MSSPSLSPPAQPEHAPPQQDKPSLPVMSMHTDYHRAESVSKPTSPVHASLYAQLQAAHAKEGTGAAAAILLARSQELLGVSQDPSALVDAATRTRLANEGAELQQYANLLMKTPQAEAISSMWTDLAAKYSDAGSGLQNEALNLWTQLYSSNEAKELGDASTDLIRQWQAYAATTEGHQMLETSTNLLKSQSGVLAQLLQGFTASVLAPAAADGDAAAAAAGSSSAEGAPGQALMISPTAMTSSAAMMKATQKVNRALADDEDVKELMARGTNLLKSYSADPANKSASPMPPGAKSPSAAAKSPSSAAGRSPSSKSSLSTTSTSSTDVADPNASVASDAAGAALASGAEYLKSLRESEVGNKMLAKAAVMLQANKDLLTPEHLTSLSSSLHQDADQRQQFLTRVKDIALDFLLSYLPSVVVPPIIGEKDKIAYEIGNLDLGGFQVDSENVVVTVDTRGAIEVRATNITCAMKNLIWAYKKLSFPKLSGKGTADANAAEVEFVMRLKIATGNQAHRPEEKSAAPPTPAARAAAAAASSPPPATSSSSKKSALSAAEAKSQTAAAAAHPSKSHTADPTKTKQPTPPQQQHASEKESAASTPSTAAAASSAGGVSGAPLPVAVAVPVSSVPSSMGAALLSTVSMDLGRPRLVMESCRITLKRFDIHIHTGFFKSAYNLLLTLFKDSVRRSLEAKLNLELATRSVLLVDTLNALAVDYLPILQRIAIKASTAAMAEDAPEDAQTPADADTTEPAADAAADAVVAPVDAAAAAAPPADADTAALEDFYGVKK